MGDNHFPEDGLDVIEDAIATKIAIMAVSGRTVGAISKELGISASRVKNIMNTDECMRAVRKIEEEGLRVAKSEIRMGVAKIAKKVLKVINDQLDKGNLQAVAPALKILGMGEEQEQQQDTSITVILPGAPLNKTFNVTPSKGDSK